MEISKEEREKKQERNTRTIMTEDFPKLMLDNEPQTQESQRIQSRIKTITSSHLQKIYIT